MCGSLLFSNTCNFCSTIGIKDFFESCAKIRKNSNIYTLLTHLLAYSMDQSPSGEANRFSANQEILLILWNPKVHYRFQRSRHLSLSLARSLQSIPSSHFLKIHFNITLPCTPGSSQVVSFLRVSSPNVSSVKGKAIPLQS